MLDPFRHRSRALRPELPFILLVGTALLAPWIVLDQGGTWHTALLSCPATVAVPCLAIEAMLWCVRLGEWLEGGRR